MSTNLKVDELRTQLSQRGLSTTGIKPILVKRLDAAIRKENQQSVDDNTTDTVLAGKKRPRASEEEDGVSISAKMNATDKFRDMGIRQLREEAARRGVSDAGSKKELLERLCADDDLEIEVKDIDEGKKRPRVSEEDGASIANVSDKINATDKFRDMGIKQLREEAARRGVSAAGSKKELLEKFCADDDLEIEVKDIDEAKEEIKVEVEDVSKNEKMIVATKKGAAVLDEWLPDHIKLQYHVMQQGDEIYDAMLNQTNVGDNNNKFFVIQVLEADDGSTFMVYYRWGRVGVKGQNNLTGPYTSRDSAIQDFEQKFYEKTKNTWSYRKNFICHPKKYTWLEMDYSDKDSEVQQKLDSTVEIQPRETKLEPQIAKFVSLICNISMMKQQMMEIGYNAEKLPLGKLSKSTILKGYDVLKRIADVIGQSDRKQLEQLSGEFYTVIPHDFGFKKMREFVIDTSQKLKSKLEMVEALSEIELATKLLKDDIEARDDPLYSHYQRLHSELTPVEASSEEFSMVAKYMQNTHAKTHLNYAADIVQVFKVQREGEAERFRKFSSTKNRMLLWHGSRLTNWTGILSQGLRIAPPEAPATGYMFGKGVYFADMFSKSANYCYASHSSTTGVMLLCEVALGDMAELSTAKYDADKLPEGKLSTKGVGTTAPNMSQAQSLEDGTIVPLGKPKKQSVPQAHLLYNEYIVYNVDQIRMRYVVQVNFNFKR